MRNKRGRLRTDFGAKWARSFGWVTWYPGGMMCFDEVATLTEEAWEKLIDWHLARTT